MTRRTNPTVFAIARRWGLPLLLLLTACSDAGTGVADDHDAVEDGGGVDVAPIRDVEPLPDADPADTPDAPSPDAAADVSDAAFDGTSDVQPDGSDDSTLPGPADGLGGPCDEGSDCEDGICLFIGEGVGVCTRLCFGEGTCPERWDCVVDPNSGGDLREICQPEGECIDRDRDDVGIGRGCPLVDCDDADPAINPRQDEVCDDIDNDCDGRVDENPLQVGLPCVGDFPGECASGTFVCSLGLLECNTALPGDEVCDGLDNDCDGSTDEDALGAPVWYRDADGDGFGDPAASVAACAAPSGYVANSRDCDDGDDARNPAAEELPGDEVDQNCDGRELCFLDADNDGFTAPAPRVVLSDDLDCADDGEAALDAPPTDCNDSNGAVFPGATEICNGIDDNCNDLVDTDALAPVTLYRDFDSDGYGDPGNTMLGCVPDVGWVRAAGDCDDTRTSVNPGAVEVCDGLDNDCDFEVDPPESIGASSWYRDADRDTWGTDATVVVACNRPSGYVSRGGDCDDGQPTVHPGAPEVCNGIDDNCDTRLDLEATDAATWYRDADEDGFGALATTIAACTAPAGYVGNSTDCNDGSDAAYPGATEVCDGLDNDCDRSVDEDDAADARTWYRDADNDGYGATAMSRRACAQPTGWVATGGDCDDTTNRASPVGIEICDGIDNNCDSVPDDASAVDAETWYEDRDNDRYGNDARSVVACLAPPGYVLVGGDCADLNAAVNPGETEVCDGIDNDCRNGVDGPDTVDTIIWYRDVDSDGFGNTSLTTRSCSALDGYSNRGNDCNDGDSAIFPGASEVCDGVDNDCDTFIDEAGATGERTWYRDVDGDNRGRAGETTLACTRPTGYAELAGDCNDDNPAVYPGAAERCNTIDDDCDSLVDEPEAVDATTYFRDRDADGYGTGDTARACFVVPPGFAPFDGDCNDTDPDINPGEDELCDDVDRDCDGLPAPPWSVDAPTWYRDLDGDGYGSAEVASEVACFPTPGFVPNGGDCNESSGDVNPGAAELCDGIDNNCNRSIDEGC